MMNHITDFLEINPVSKDQAQEWLCHQANVQTVYPVYSTDREKFTMKPETKKLLEEFYRPFNAKLVDLTGSKRFLWTTKYKSNIGYKLTFHYTTMMMMMICTFLAN